MRVGDGLVMRVVGVGVDAMMVRLVQSYDC